MVLSTGLTTPFFPSNEVLGAEADSELDKEEDEEEWLSFFKEDGRIGEQGGEGDNSAAD